MQRRKDKGKDRPPVDPHREYLDAEFSDEEETHDEDAFKVTEYRQIYKTDELQELVQCVKNMTILSGVDEDEWTFDILANIREFFQNPKQTTLCIYLRDNLLETSLGFPSVPVQELTYFVREPMQVFYLSNFRDEILFGSINTAVESHILSISRDLLTPIFYKIASWPDSVRSDFYTNLETFLCNVTDLTYKLLGLTVMYVPSVVTGLAIEDAVTDKELVKRLEAVVVHWTTQIRIALSDQEQISPQRLLRMEDQFEFWRYRYNNLSSVYVQVQNEKMKHVIDILLATQSTYVRQFIVLRDEIISRISEASSNIDFLDILRDPVEDLNKSEKPSHVNFHIPKIIHLMRTIWTQSPFYSETKRITNLFQILSNQVITVLKKFINLKKILAGYTKQGIELFENCIQVCKDYQRIYQEIANVYNEKLDGDKPPWDLNGELIFQYINIFISRCCNMIEICQAMVDFARMDKTLYIPEPKFSGTRGEEYETICQKMENMFKVILRKVKRQSSKILNVQDSSWNDDLFNFRNEIKDLEIIIQNLADDVFTNINNVLEGIRELQGFLGYMNRPSLSYIFEQKVLMLWTMYKDDIQQTKREFVEEREEYQAMTEYFSGRALNFQLKFRYLQSIRETLDQSKWMPFCKISEEVIQQQNLLSKSVNDLTADFYQKWVHNVGDNPLIRLDNYLMRSSEINPGLIECNIDPGIMNLCREADHWLNLKFELPVYVQMIHSKWETILYVYESVLSVTIAYNRIVQALSPIERNLFRELIRQLDRKIYPGLNKLTWNTEHIDAYIEDCFKQTANLQEFLDVYKKANTEILKIGEEICNSPLIKIRPNHTYTLQEFQGKFVEVRRTVVEAITHKYNEVIEYVLVIYEGLEEVIVDSLVQWKLYLRNLDIVLEEAFKQCLKHSLTILYDALHGDGATPPSPLLIVQANLIDKKIDLQPTLQDIANTIAKILDDLLEPIKSMRRLTDKFKVMEENVLPFWRIYENDEELEQLQQMLNSEVNHCFVEVQSYIKIWEPFKEIWETNRELYMQRYEKRQPNVESFVKEINKYTEEAENVLMQETVMPVHFLNVHSDRLKGAIIEHCSIWRTKLTSLLYRITESRIDQFYHYIADNSKKIMKEPTDLISMQFALQLFERLTTEIPLKEEEFPKIQEQYETLENFEIPLTFELRRKYKDMDRSWNAYLKLLASCDVSLQEKKEEFKKQLLKDTKIFLRDISSLIGRFRDTGPFTSEWATKAALTWLMFFRNEMETLRKREKKLISQLTVFGISQPDSMELTKLEKDFTAIELVWQLTKEWDEAWERYKTSNFWTIEMEEMDVTANVLFRKLTRLSKELKEKNWEILEATRLQVDKFRRTLPLITALKNPAMRKRHWARVKEAVNKDFDETSEEFTLSAIMKMEMQTFADQIYEISNAATMELAIENNIKHIISIWEETYLDMSPYKDKGIFRLKSVTDIMQNLDDHLVQLSSMKTTVFVEPFTKEVDYWEHTLSTIGETLEMVLIVQRDYIYMDNIFTAEDIRKQLPRETDEFDKLTITWTTITSTMAKKRLALLAALEPPGLLETLNKLHSILEGIQRSLEQYLETKRHVFPRFYFISNDDLLEILANSKRPDLIQPHVKKLFENIKLLKIDKSVTGKYLAMGMLSAEGEYVEFSRAVLLEGQVEAWLLEIEATMRHTLREVLKQCRLALRKTAGKRDRWVKEWPSQPGITSTQIQWTGDCTRTLLYCKLANSKKPLRKLRKRQNQALATYSAAIRSNLATLQRLKFKAIVVIEIHARDVIEKLYKLNCRDVSAFEWLSQLRFYWDKDIDNCIIRQTNTFFTYGYEYLGNSGRLVITPLTDRCYITLTTALHLYRGGSPKGPAGTGKTETVKDLGKALGFNVIVQNCSEGLDYRSMGKLFSGLAQSGAWGCFDEFNRINVEVLSVVAQQILSILTALSQKLTRFVFEGTEIALVHTVGIFITMNPGYAGRTELPDNLKSMFRPISMMVPDSSMIAEINLFGEGFEDTRTLARKIFTLYSLAQQQLSKQYHYDFGLRGIVTLTRYAGKKKRLHPNLPDDEVILLAMKDMNAAKLTSDDLPLFIAITSDLFPNVEVPTVDYDEMRRYIHEEIVSVGLQPIPLIFTKVIELYETKISRHSSMIVGESNTAKTTTWRILQKTLTSMKNDGKAGFNVVHVYPINPKALSLGELYGEYNLSTGEWYDGVLSSIMRKTCADTTPDEKWILFDGPVDALWIENMNSVMDDNKILTLINNERITLTEQVSLLFEVQDLAVASPATVSRAGMVYNDYKDLGWRPHVNSWLLKYKKTPEFVEEMDELFNRAVDVTLAFTRYKCEEPVPVPELQAVQSLCKLLEVLATPENAVQLEDDRDAYSTICRIWFIFCMIWSLCSPVNEEGRQKVDNFIREMEGSFPLRDTVYEYYVDVRQRSFVSWEERLSQSWRFQPGIPFYKIIVPTVDTVRYNYIVNALLEKGYPVLLVGPVGTGKTSTAHSVLREFDHSKYSVLMINMSAQTTSINIQNTIESRLEKRTKGVYIPVGGKKMIIFLDDFNMPMKDTYGSQPPLELIRQWLDYGFWYDRQKQLRLQAQNMQLMAAMGPAGGGRNTISNRLLTKFNIINMTFPAEKQIFRIYSNMLNQQVTEFHPEVKGLVNEITVCTIDLYNNVVLKLLPTPAKIHYLFNLRDISRIYQGLLRSHKDYHYSKSTFLRLWIHESFRVFSDRLVDEKDREWFVTHLNDQLGKHFDLTFNNLCPEKRCPLFGSFMNAWDVYEDLKDIAKIRRFMEEQIGEFNAIPGMIHLNMIFFRDAIEHICRIVRVISQARGHMLLMGTGGNGRKSLARFASYICEQDIYQISVTKQYGVPEFREDIKALYSMAGVENNPTSFLFNDGQVVDEQFLEIVNNMLSTGEVANLYKNDEMEDIKNRLSKDLKKTGMLPTQESIYEFLIERVRSNLHLILMFSPIGESFRSRLRQNPALINCTSIDWFLEWPEEALLEVGNKFLMNLNLTLTITGGNKEIMLEEKRQGSSETPLAPLQDRMRTGIASVFSVIHKTVSRFSRRMATEMKRYYYVTPTNFLELVTGYKQMLETKRSDLADQASKLRNGLFKIDDTKETVKDMAAELEITQQQVDKSTRECDEYLVTIVSQRRDADETQKMVIAKSSKIAEEQEECKKLERIARADLASVEPALNEALKALDALNKKDLSEIKSFTRPPAKVEMVMEAVMILKGSEPTWAESKRQLGDVNFLNTLRDFDKDHISERVLRAIAKYTSNPEFDPIKVGVVSIAAKSLCMWVIAMEKYGKLFRIVRPKREKLEMALKSLKQKEAALEEATQQLQKLNEELQRLQGLYDTKMKEKDELIRLAESLQLKLDRAAMLVDGLSGERIRWEQTVGSLAEFFDWLIGDCLISTAFVCYLGPFVSNYRQVLIDIWMKKVQEADIPTTLELKVQDFLVDPTTIREWNIQGLPSDDFSTENGIIVTRGKRWPLIIDPQCQAVKWIKNMEAKNSLNVIDFGQPDFTRVLEHAIRFGGVVLLENVGETLDPVMNSILQKALVKSGDQVMINFNDRLITYDDKFRLFITTKLPNPHYAPEISTKTTLCNFAIKEQGLEAQLLGIVVRKEKPQLEEQKDNLVVSIAASKRALKELEDKILHLLNVATDSLLDDVDLLNALQTSKATSISIEESLVVAEETEREIDLARGGYQSCSSRAAVLFFVLNDMSRIDPMYQFSLDAYISLFVISIDKSEKSPKLSDRIDNLNDYHTYALYRNTCRGLFEEHKLLFSFHMCIKILDSQGKINPAEYTFLLRGGIVLDRENQPDKPAPWLTDETWDNITELDKLPGFHGVVASFEQLSRDWHNWYISTRPENKKLVGDWEGICNSFQKMLFIRSCRPDRIAFAMTKFIVGNRGQKFVEPPVLNLKSVLDDSVAQTPLIFVLSPGADPTQALIQLADAEDMTSQFVSLSLGQGQAPIATLMIQRGAKEGSWVFLANCHLSLSWMPQLDKIVDNISTSKTLHPQFRLWLSSRPTPEFPISILQAGIKMTTEPPKGLKANMKRLYSLITPTKFELCTERFKYKNLLFCLVFFHSVLLERKKFQQLGWNVVYSFNDSDFEVSENLLQVYLDEYPETPWESLKYLIAGVCYGGHVTDDWDRRLLMTYVQQYFTDEVLVIPYYRLSSLPTYYVPRDGSLESYHDFIGMLPNSDRPEAFGQHPNADIASQITEARNIFEILMSIQVQVESAEEESSKEDKVFQFSTDILSKIPDTIDYDTTEKLIGPEKDPLQVVLLQEIRRYNALLVKTRDSLVDLQSAIQGLIVMSTELEEIFTCIYEGRVPSIWLTAYPSMKLLGTWTRDLINRVEHFANWAETTHPPILFWLAAFTFPTAFLTAVLQVSARNWGISIDSLSWEFTVFTSDDSTINEPPEDGVYIRSIFLEGAGWDKKNGMLIEPAPMELITSMPVIYFKPVEQAKKKTKGLYNCPCYYYPQRSGGQDRPSIIVAVDLKSGPEGSDFWVKRGTALLLSLAV